MANLDTSMGGAARQFPSTMWSEIRAAADPGDGQNRERLGRLMQAYWKPVYAYLRTAWSKRSEDAKDLTQAFFAHLMQNEFLSRLRNEKGSFRAYLKQSLRHFVIDAERRASTRRPDGPLLSLEAAPEELEALGPVAPDETPEQAYDRKWFECLLERSVARMKESLVRSGKALQFEAFKAYCLDPQGQKPPTYADIAQRLGVKESDVLNYLAWSRRMLRGFLQEAIRDYVSDDEELEGELEKALTP